VLFHSIRHEIIRTHCIEPTDYSRGLIGKSNLEQADSWCPVFAEYFRSTGNEDAASIVFLPNSTTVRYSIPLVYLNGLVLCIPGVLLIMCIRYVLPRQIRARRMRRNTCPLCAYDLRGLPTPRCPECGGIPRDIIAADNPLACVPLLNTDDENPAPEKPESSPPNRTIPRLRITSHNWSPQLGTKHGVLGGLCMCVIACVILAWLALLPQITPWQWAARTVLAFAVTLLLHMIVHRVAYMTGRRTSAIVTTSSIIIMLSNHLIWSVWGDRAGESIAIGRTFWYDPGVMLIHATFWFIGMSFATAVFPSPKPLDTPEFPDDT
jgi:hypothetical protein